MASFKISLQAFYSTVIKTTHALIIGFYAHNLKIIFPQKLQQSAITRPYFQDFFSTGAPQPPKDP